VDRRGEDNLTGHRRVRGLVGKTYPGGACRKREPELGRIPQYVLEQTMQLPPGRQYDTTASPLAIHSRLTGRELA
jgi:hypothetical protein